MSISEFLTKFEKELHNPALEDVEHFKNSQLVVKTIDGKILQVNNIVWQPHAQEWQLYVAEI